MAVKPGYKETEIGLIPEIWKVSRLSELASITTGNKNTQDKIPDGMYPFFVRSQQVERINSYSFEGESVLTAGDGVGTGKIFHYYKGKFDFHQRVYRIGDFNSEIDGFYFFKYFSSKFYDRVMSMNAKSSVDSVRREMIADMFIALPPLPEQKAIASALSDTDDLIAALEALIAKRQAIKQGAMQELLTGRKRLPGFEGEWDKKRLGDIARVISGGTPSTNEPAFWDGEIAWCTPSDLTSDSGKYLLRTQKNITPAGMKRSGASLLPPGTLLFCSRASIGEMKISTFPVTTNQGFQSLICGPQVLNEFLYYLINLEIIKFIEVSKGSTFLEISGRALRNISLTFPNLSEQQAITSILSDMDVEIAHLEDQLGKTQALKQGMMQELLTGRIRLI